ncbi:MADS-box transcription factor ANR1-like [Aegilops tauschii subsp. strangulata]|uniref:MADS-box transcription factor ANR1-like n=1 Tax=Aegilops tauschii subsp. strangulata TaxID=200361 RepID=UPI00098A4E59|nr:MADS-box transcription factor ANR1-like [Aegilops tauschii subsp. strangulata]
MARGKIVIRRIENMSSRKATFSKRRHGLLMKSRELAILCDVQVSVMVFSSTSRLYEYASSIAATTMGMAMPSIIQNYQSAQEHHHLLNSVSQVMLWEGEVRKLHQEIQMLQEHHGYKFLIQFLPVPDIELRGESPDLKSGNGDGYTSLPC